MNIKKVDIISASYNSLPFLYRTWHSIQSQTYKNWTWIICDDCSTDGSFEKLLEFSNQDPRIIILRNEVNKGAAVSRNNALAKTSGDFIAFLDADDLWLPQKLEKQLIFMESNNIDFSFTAYELINEQGNQLNREVDIHLEKPVNYNDMLYKKATIGCSTVMLRKAAFKDISMPLMRARQDYALWLKLLKTDVNAYPINEVLMQYRITSGSISRNKLKVFKYQWQVYRRIENLSLIKSVVCFINYAWRGLYKSIGSN